MIQVTTAKSYFRKRGNMVLALLILYISAGFFVLKNYLSWSSPAFLLGLITLIATVRIETIKVNSYRYAIAALITGVLTCFFPIKTLFFFFLSFSILYTIEYTKGRLPFLSLVALGILSPVCSHIILQFGFTIRLYLSAFAGVLLKLLEPGTIVAGNIITINGIEYAVDPACVGLNMMITSLITGVLLITILQKKSGKHPKWWQSITLLLSIIVLNIFCNLIRIMFLSYYNILPENILHDVAGLVCFLLYVLIPTYGLIVLSTQRWRYPEKTVAGEKKTAPLAGLHISLLFILGVTCMIFSKRPDIIVFNPTVVSPGYNHSILSEKGVLKLDNEKALVYIKPIATCYSGEHHPVFCWTGSGYTFEKVAHQQVNGLRFYTATLENEKDRLYTAWWYDNGYTNTTEQWQWRWDMLKGKGSYALINITAASEKELTEQVKYFTQSIELGQMWTKQRF